MRTKTVTFNLPTGPVERTVRDMTFHATSVQTFDKNGKTWHRAECSVCHWHSIGYPTASEASDIGFTHTQD